MDSKIFKFEMLKVSNFSCLNYVRVFDENGKYNTLKNVGICKKEMFSSVINWDCVFVLNN